MEYPHAEAFIISLNTINGNPFLEPSAKHLLKKEVPLPCITIKVISKSSKIGKVMVIRYHECSASLGPFSPPITTKFFLLP